MAFHNIFGENIIIEFCPQRQEILKLDNLRKYGVAPFRVGVVHGGPGAAGEMAPLARQLACQQSILEPIQTADSLDGQVEELQALLLAHGKPPLVLIGYSWGAWLSFIVAAHYPDLVKKLILVSSGPFEEKYAINIAATRLARLHEKDRGELQSLMKTLNHPLAKTRNQAFGRIGNLIFKADSFDPLENDRKEIGSNFAIFQKVWPQGAELRKSGKLLELGRNIQAPVTAIHGDYDPHPAAGVQKPLATVLHDFRFFLLKNCGHSPWTERQAKEEFYLLLARELGIPASSF